MVADAAGAREGAEPAGHGAGVGAGEGPTPRGDSERTVVNHPPGGGFPQGLQPGYAPSGLRQYSPVRVRGGQDARLLMGAAPMGGEGEQGDDAGE